MTIKTWQTSWMIRLIAALLSGAIAPLAFSPFGFWPVMLVSIAALYLLVNRQSLHKAAWLGLAYGLGFYQTG